MDEGCCKRSFARRSEKRLEDLKFLNRVCQDARGTPPTLLEVEYFKADKDPKKNEKLLDLLLKDPALAKKLGDSWKKKMLAETEIVWRVLDVRSVQPMVVRQLLLSRHEGQALPEQVVKLLDQLLKENRSEEQILEALATATMGRLPTESEKKLVSGGLARQQDKRAGWLEVLRTFAGTQEAKKYAESLNRSDAPTKKPEAKK